MRARVVCMASAKGGSGKTGLTATFSTFLTRLGKQVLMIDADFATNGLTLLYLKEVRAAGDRIREEGREASGLQELVTDGARCDVAEITPLLQLIPASFRLDVADVSEKAPAIREVRAAMETLRGNFDFIWIDAQAGADTMSAVTMARGIADDVIIVSEYDPMSAAGVERLKSSLRDDLSFDRTWMLLNKMLPEFVQSFSDFMEVARYLPPIPWDAEVVRAYSRRQLAIDSETARSYTLSIIRSLKALLGNAIADDLSKWLATQAVAIRQPIEEQYDDAERELRALLVQKEIFARRRNWRRLALSSITLLTALFVAAGLVSAFASRFAGFLREVGYFQAFLVATTLVAGIVWQLSWTRLRRNRATVDEEIEAQRVERQHALLEGRLKELELLKRLDPESLIREGGRTRKETTLRR